MHGSKVRGNLLVMNFKVLVYSVSFPNPESLKNQKLGAGGGGGRAPHSEWWGGGQLGRPTLLCCGSLPPGQQHCLSTSMTISFTSEDSEI